MRCSATWSGSPPRRTGPPPGSYDGSGPTRETIIYDALEASDEGLARPEEVISINRKRSLYALIVLTIAVAIGGVTVYFLQQQAIFSGTTTEAALAIYAQARDMDQTNASAEGAALVVTQNGKPTYQVTVTGVELTGHGAVNYGDLHTAYTGDGVGGPPMVDGLFEIRSSDDDDTNDAVTIALDSVTMPSGYETASFDWFNVSVPGYVGNGAYLVNPANLLEGDATGVLSDSGNSNNAGYRCLHAIWSMTDQDIGPDAGSWGFTLNITVVQG